jgi:DNA-binding response OmpR family regulator
VARILVIDDDRMMRELYQEILTRRGHAVILAENGTEGLAKIEENPDLIIVDLTMADGDGYEFLKRLRAVPGRATTPVIVSSGQLAGDVAIAGADRFLAKPFRGNELLALVDELLSSSRGTAS